MGRTPLDPSPGELPQLDHSVAASRCVTASPPCPQAAFGKWPLPQYGGSCGPGLTSTGPRLSSPPTIPRTGIPLLFLGGLHLCHILLVQTVLNLQAEALRGIGNPLNHERDPPIESADEAGEDTDLGTQGQLGTKELRRTKHFTFSQR